VNRNLEHYIFKIENFLTNDECLKGIVELENNQETWLEHKFYDPRTGESYQRVKEADTKYGDGTQLQKVIMEKLWFAIDKYIKNYNFPWLPGWEGYSTPRINKYYENKEMDLHADLIHSIFDGEKKGIPTLSCLGVLNDNFVGGEFIMFDNMEIKMNPGDLIIFPCTFTYPHKVKPVTEGTRYSYISWTW